MQCVNKWFGLFQMIGHMHASLARTLLIISRPWTRKTCRAALTPLLKNFRNSLGRQDNTLRDWYFTDPIINCSPIANHQWAGKMAFFRYGSVQIIWSWLMYKLNYGSKPGIVDNTLPENVWVVEVESSIQMKVMWLFDVSP